MGAPPQRTRVDWDAARAFYISLAPHERSYAKVQDAFGVSEPSVRKWARRQNWTQLAADADRKVAERAEATAIRTRGERVEAALRFVDKAIDRATERINAQDLDVKASDVPHLMKLAELLLGEPTDRIQISQLEPLLDAYDAALDRLRDLATDQGEADRIIGGLDEQLLALAAQARQRAEA